MTGAHKFLLIPIGLLFAAVIIKPSGSALYRKNVVFNKVDEEVRSEIERLFRNTLKRLADFEMDLPAKIVMQRLENEEGNTFNDPFLVGNSHEVKASHYVSDPVSWWCSGLSSRQTQQYFEHKNRRIDVTFDCNRPMVFPPLRTFIRYLLIAMFANAVFIVLKFSSRLLKNRFSHINIEITAVRNEKPLSFDDYQFDDDLSAFMENVEKWDASRLESCHD
ncbi:hypothetical protein CRE_08672 [Caenorhabditis remanei]|uniref:Transmembrane protein 231 n=1 Tax=Caenorhabditis remanei TaxID=31234 RepID=E3LJA5_CAERE|nr:hypothetical protein CRE_08672 [Caenorhabditis remanei]